MKAKLNLIIALTTSGQNSWCWMRRADSRAWCPERGKRMLDILRAYIWKKSPKEKYPDQLTYFFGLRTSCGWLFYVIQKRKDHTSWSDGLRILGKYAVLEGQWGTISRQWIKEVSFEKDGKRVFLGALSDGTRSSALYRKLSTWKS